MAKKKTKKAKKGFQKPKVTISKKHKILFGIFLFLFAIGLLMAFISFLFTWQSDQSLVNSVLETNEKPENWLSKFGAIVSHFFIYDGFGIAVFNLPFMIALTGLKLFLNLKKIKLRNIWFWGLYVMITFSLFFAFFGKTYPLLGGVVGFEVKEYLTAYIGNFGLGLLIAFMLITYLVVRLQLTPEKIINFFRTKKDAIEEDFQKAKAANQVKAQNKKVAAQDTDQPKKEESKPEVAPEVEFENNMTSAEEKSAPIQKPSTEKEEDTKPPQKIVINSENKDDDLSLEVETAQEEEDEIDSKSERIVENFGEFDPKLDLPKYQFPSLDLLKDYSKGGGITIDEKELEENKNKIVETLKNYKIGIAQIKATVGPTVTLYEIIPEAGVRISKIRNLEDDIALSLSALGIRIIAPIPGRGTIGIEVPNQNPSIVSMRSVAASQKFQKAEMQLPVAFGKTISNETFVADLAKMPHLLMAGATGQGKSVGLNVILTSLLYHKHPAEVKFVLVDPKKVELTLFNKIERHYLAK
ncbi:MAG: DNA translocase FtsK 4TM domain-containing protein, partial [Lactococcus lactis]|nr:DNA translocase FtsK 4TM domain-containing protein [Lactococcus lactis]